MLEESLDSYSNYESFVKRERRKHSLHTLAQDRLKALLSRIDPHTVAVSEVSDVLGGRNDLIVFSFNERRVVFECFFTPSQVPQDLRLLEQSTADVKIAILLDERINPKLAQEYFRKKPDSFPFLWLRILLMPQFETFCLAQLRELMNEQSPIRQMRRILATPAGARLEQPLQERLARIEQQVIGQRTSTSANLRQLTVRQIAALMAIRRIHDLGVPIERLRPLYAWLQESISFAFTLVAAGMQAFLITDLGVGNAIWSDGDFADDLILGAEEDGAAYIVMCLNKIINDLYVKSGLDKRPLAFHFFHSYAEFVGRFEPIWVTNPDLIKKPESNDPERGVG